MASVVAASSVALSFSLGASRTTQHTLALSEEVSDFLLQLATSTSAMRIATFEASVYRNGSGVTALSRNRAVRLEKQFKNLRRHYDRAKRKAPTLRMADGRFRKFEKTVLQYVLFDALKFSEVSLLVVTLEPFDFYRFFYRDVSQETQVYEEETLKFAERKYQQKVSKVSENADSVALAAIIGLFCVNIVTLLVLLFTIVALFDEGNKKVSTMEQLARQQAHENRNKYAPALHILETLGDYADPPDVVSQSKELLKDDFPRRLNWISDSFQLKTDARVAASVLREVEHLHQTRLDCYKIMQGQYKSTTEIFELVTFMSERMETELAIAKANSTQNVQFVVKVPDDLAGKEIHVKCDQYVLGHIVTNLLANARKFCFRGSIVLTFVGQSDDHETETTLTFRVSDTGSGIPESIKPRLFNSEVATADSRGTGLGLPSVKLFASAVGGYAKLISSTTQDSNGGEIVKTEDVDDDVMSLRRFSPRGQKHPRNTAVFCRNSLNRTISSSPTTSSEDDSDAATTNRLSSHGDESSASSVLPKKAQVVVLDDSQINRRCIIMALRKAAKLADAHDWTFTEFENAEASRSFLEALKDHFDVIVTVDENMQSRGGTMLGSELIRWLRQNCHFKGLIIGASGDTAASACQLANGANLNFGKPLKKAALIRDDLETTFQEIAEQEEKRQNYRRRSLGKWPSSSSFFNATQKN